jgi:hypothetical protein
LFDVSVGKRPGRVDLAKSLYDTLISIVAGFGAVLLTFAAKISDGTPDSASAVSGHS